MRALALILLLPLLAGCTDCSPLIDIRHCLPDQCQDVNAIEFDANLHNPPWSDMESLMRNLSAGAHVHESWTQAQIDEYSAYQFHEPDLYFDLDGERYRLRLISCT